MPGKKGGHNAIRRANWRARAESHAIDLATRTRMMAMVRALYPDADTRKLTADQLRRDERRY